MGSGEIVAHEWGKFAPNILCLIRVFPRIVLGFGRFWGEFAISASAKKMFSRNFPD